MFNLEIIKWIKQGADPSHPDAISYSQLQDLEIEGLIELRGITYESGVQGLLINLSPIGEYEYQRLVHAL